MYSAQSVYNTVRNFNKLQGTTHPSDLHVQIRRDINNRYITVENSSIRPIGFAIVSYVSGPVPKILKTLLPGEIVHLGINSQGSYPQYVWILSPETSQPVSRPCLIRSTSNSLVLRDGVNKWWVDFFSRPVYSA